MVLGYPGAIGLRGLRVGVFGEERPCDVCGDRFPPEKRSNGVKHSGKKYASSPNPLLLQKFSFVGKKHAGAVDFQRSCVNF